MKTANNGAGMQATVMRGYVSEAEVIAALVGAGFHREASLQRAVKRRCLRTDLFRSSDNVEDTDTRR